MDPNHYVAGRDKHARGSTLHLLRQLGRSWCPSPFQAGATIFRCARSWSCGRFVRFALHRIDVLRSDGLGCRITRPTGTGGPVVQYGLRLSRRRRFIHGTGFEFAMRARHGRAEAPSSTRHTRQAFRCRRWRRTGRKRWPRRCRPPCERPRLCRLRWRQKSHGGVRS